MLLPLVLSRLPTAKTGDKITIALDMNKMHLFDKETEKTILN